jgi:hypothetical protein
MSNRSSIQTPRRTSRAGPQARPRPRLGVRILPAADRFPWRLVSTAIILAIIGLGAFIFTNPMFYVLRAEVGGLRYVSADEIYTQAGIVGYHILWVEPDVVAERIAANPSLDMAQVVVRWPARVVILVREREPAIVWEQAGKGYWVDVRGHLMLMRRDLPNLVRVINEGEAIPFQCPGPRCADQDTISIDTDVVLGTQHLKTLRGNIDVLYYDPSRGLSYQDGRGWRAYFGVGANMDIKLAIYETLVADLMARGIQPVYIDVSNPDAPFYRVER